MTPLSTSAIWKVVYRWITSRSTNVADVAQVAVLVLYFTSQVVAFHALSYLWIHFLEEGGFPELFVDGYQKDEFLNF